MIGRNMPAVSAVLLTTVLTACGRTTLTIEGADRSLVVDSAIAELLKDIPSLAEERKHLSTQLASGSIEVRRWATAGFISLQVREKLWLDSHGTNHVFSIRSVKADLSWGLLGIPSWNRNEAREHSYLRRISDGLVAHGATCDLRDQQKSIRKPGKIRQYK
jgi:hypothetical protein